MKTFNNINDLQKYIKTQTGQQTVMGLSKTKSALKQAADLLQTIMQEELQKYYDSYTPVVYERTYELLNSLRVSPIQQIGKQLRITVYFDRDMATHPSLFGGEPGYTAWLIDQGWQWKNKDVDIYRLSRFEGFHFVDSSIERFNSQNRWGFRIHREMPNR